jgi:hypothetical protein
VESSPQVIDDGLALVPAALIGYMAALHCLKFDQRGLVGKMGNSSRSTSVTFAMAVVLKFGAGGFAAKVSRVPHLKPHRHRHGHAAVCYSGSTNREA